MMTIGYQGIQGSNSERAAEALVQQEKLYPAKLVPLLNSENVILALQNKTINRGVVAIQNSIGGRVRETDEALARKKIEIIATLSLKIKHAICFSSPQVEPNQITEVRSHEQALLQCAQNLKKYFPGARQIPIEDTAIGAKRLSEGQYDKNTAVLCSAEAAQIYQLYIHKAEFQDSEDNETQFALLSYLES